MCYRPNVAPPIGPIIGGALAARLGWKWIFWFLCITGAVCLLLVVLTLPETARSIVGNGSIPATGINRVPISWRRKPDKSSGTESVPKPKFGCPNPIACLHLLLRKDVAIVLLCNGIYYMTYCCIQASLSTIFLNIYPLDELQAGLIYIPFGVSCLFSVFSWGIALIHNIWRGCG
jgi:MFS family permease